MALAGAFTFNILARMALTAPVISSTVSPRTRSAIRIAPICEGVASPAIMRSNTCEDSSRENAAPVAALAMSALNSSIMIAASMRPARGNGAVLARVPRRRQFEKILQDHVAMFGGDALGVELHTVDRPRLVRQSHDQAVVGLRGD